MIWAGITLLAVPVFTWLLIQSPQVQTYLIHKTTTFIHSRTGINITIRRIDFRPIKSIILKDVFVADLNNDTLLFANQISASIFEINSKLGLYKFGKASIENSKFFLQTDSTGVMNLTALLQKVSGEPKDSTSGNFSLSIDKILINNLNFKLKQQSADSISYGSINFQNLNLLNLQLAAKDFTINNDTISLTINTLKALDHSGFNIDNLRARFALCSSYMHFDNLRIRAHGSSISANKIYLDYSSWKSFSNFTSDVKINANLEGTYINTNALSYIVSTFKKYSFGISINGQLKGRINDIRARNLEIGFGSQTKIIANANLVGLPDIENTLFSIDLKKLKTSKQDVEFLKDSSKNASIISLPKMFDRLGQIEYVGKFSGYLSDFITYGELTTALGKANFDVWMKPSNDNKSDFKGKFHTKNFNLGKFLDDTLIGSISINSKILGSLDKSGHLKAKTDAKINLLEANSYQYKDISISGNLSETSYSGIINLNDPNCKINFLGNVDFTDSIPIFDFSLLASHINLVKLNFNKTDSLSAASFLLNAKFSGNSLDNSKGEIKLLNSTYRNHRGEFKIADLTIHADNTKESKVITLKSDIAEGEIRSRLSFSRFPYYLNKVLSRHIPALKEKQTTNNSQNDLLLDEAFNDFLIKFRLKKTDKITRVIAPELKIAANSSLFGILNPKDETLTVKVKILEASSGTTYLKDVSINGETHDSILIANISTPLIKIGSGFIKNLKLSTTASNNKISSNISWNNYSKPTTKGNINILTDFNSYTDSAKTISVTFNPSEITINDTSWNLAHSTILIDSSKLDFQNFKISNKRQHIILSGRASKNSSDTLSLSLRNIDISFINLYLHDFGYNLKGIINGEALSTSILSNPSLEADIIIDNFQVNNSLVGKATFRSTWSNDEKKISVYALNERHDTSTFLLAGDYFIESKRLDFNLDVNKAKLKLIEPILEGNVSNIKGTIDGKLKINGNTDKPAVDGIIKLNETEAIVDFLNTRYRINDLVEITNSDLFFKNFKLSDQFGQIATLNGSIKTSFFKNFNLGLRLGFSNFLCMNTREFDNDSFYGTVFGSGFVDFIGNPDDLHLNINLKTENKTAIYLPLSTTSTVEESKFLSFVNNDPDLIIIEEENIAQPSSSANINISIELQVTPEAEAQIIIDKKLGDIIKASGSGNLRMEINPSKDIFNMFGRYTISQGDYLFTLSGVINKRFKIAEGSYIDWNGDPLDATLDINAIYRVKTSLKQLLLDDSYSTRVPVDCKIMLSQKLLSPSIKFGIEFPNLDQQTRLLTEGVLNTEEKINTQFLGLLVINSFISDPSLTSGSTSSSNNNLGTTGIYNTASEMLSNQLSNWLSQWSKNFDIGINYRPGLESELSSDQLELAFSTQILDDRVTINSNVDVGGNRNNNNTFVGDFTVDVKLNKSGKLRGKAFARNNNDILPTTQQNNYTTGAGIVYREDFNSFSELFKSLFNKSSKDSLENSSPLPDSDSIKKNKNDSSFIKIN
ncbi:MAG: hypothetical protein PWR03_1619 [Tenuifilum sp.]|uniref:translocation/assembly module TamB domain-containing protein n=1 Tax=Tenuifilum sp. TaxID=2760880 RepID=UPI0024AC3B70|nr:translocation/assembly module TamB domain-containing protein [Tenuifilum sp.]MDI3527436.1 hypothetical protein [Tenuifilum sp.]